MSTSLLDPPGTNVAQENPRVKKSNSTELDKTARVPRETIVAGFDQSNLSWKNMDWIVLVWMVAMHAGCLAAPFFFSWSALAVCVVLHWLTSSIGICLAYHRYLSHRSFKLARPAEFFVLLCGALSGEGSPLTWVATHRLHHCRSDKKGDPHSPLEGPWWSHMLWLFILRDKQQHQALFRQFTPDLVDRPMLQFFERTYGLWLVATGAVLFALGGLPFLLWGLCVRMTFAYHSTWFVNSATHLWGYRNYETPDQSRNLWWVALLAYGEGWHNNHHAYPRVARAGHRRWEIDMTWWVIKGLKACGLATDVHDRVPSTNPHHSTK